MRKSNIDKCKDKQHPLEELYSFSGSYDEEIVVRWCPECGAVVIDLDTDGRVNPGARMKMRTSNIYRDCLTGDLK